MAVRTVSTGQHQVEHDEVDRVGVRGVQRGERRGPVPDDRHGMSVPLEIEAQQLREPGLVLDDQDPGAGGHARHPSGTPIKES